MMQYKGYFGDVKYDSEAKILHGEVVGTRDVITFQADSLKNVERSFRESLDDYLDFCQSRGEVPDKPISGRFLVRTDAGLHRQLSNLAEASGKSLNTLVTELLSRGLSTELAQVTANGSPRSSRSGKRRPIKNAVRVSKTHL